jgi:hypothetical protein
MDDERIRPVTRRRTILILVPMLLIAGIGALVPAAIRAAAHGGLAALGFSDSRGGSVSLGLHHVRIADIEIGEKGRTTVAVAFSPSRLIHGQLDSIDVSNTVLHAVVALNGALEFDGFTMPATQPKPAKAISLPADRVDITGAALELETPFGTSTVTSNGLVTGIDDGLHLTGAVNLSGAAITGSAPADFTLTSAGWSLSLNPIHIAFAGKTDTANAIDGHLTLASASDTGLTGDADLTGENLTIQATPIGKLSLNFTAAPGSLSGGFQLSPKSGGTGIEAGVRSDATGVAATLKAGFSEVGVFSKAIGSTVQGPVQANITLHVDPAAAKMPVTLDLTYDGVMPGGVLLRNAKLKESGAFDAAENAVTLTSCGGFSADGLTLSGVTLAKLSGCLGPAPDGALFDQDPLGKIAFTGIVSNLAATVQSASGTLAQATIQSLRMAAHTTDGRLTGFTAGMDNGAISLPALGTGLNTLSVKAESAADGAVSGTVSGNFGPSAPKSPALPIAGTLGGSVASGPTLTATAGSMIKASLAGKTAKLDMPATELGEGGADLLRLVPGLATSASKLSGKMALSLTADWSGAATTSRGSITLKDVGATTPNFTLEGVDTAVSLTSLSPFSTADSQVLTMKRLLVGVPLTDGKVTFGLDQHGKLNIADAHWSIAGGTLGTYDQQLDLYGPNQNLGLVVKGVELAQLLTLVNVNGLSAEGTVEGAIPIRRTKDIIRIEHGVLQTSAAGVLRYDPADTPSFLQGQPGEGTAILRDALKDFRYQQLSLTIDGNLGGEEQIKLKLNGANPTLYGGLPVALNVNLSGALDSIARSSVEAYTNPTKAVHRKLEQKPGDKK